MSFECPFCLLHRLLYKLSVAGPLQMPIALWEHGSYSNWRECKSSDGGMIELGHKHAWLQGVLPHTECSHVPATQHTLSTYTLNPAVATLAPRLPVACTALMAERPEHKDRPAAEQPEDNSGA